MTESAPSKPPKLTKLYGFGVVLLVLLSLLAIVLATGIIYDSKNTLKFGGKQFKIEKADTDELRSKGLSGRESIKSDETMLFVYDSPKQLCFWMKDMKFNIDMVWIGADKRIVEIESNVNPETYPREFCHDNSQFVAEFAAGTVRLLGIKTGDTVQF